MNQSLDFKDINPDLTVHKDRKLSQLLYDLPVSRDIKPSQLTNIQEIKSMGYEKFQTNLKE